tara:strand:- start:694 stop:966 length:273 start_codon:yes stop_codon:yes gene_type:complete
MSFANAHLLSLIRVHTNRPLYDITVSIGDALHNGKVLLFYITLFKLFGQRQVRRIVFGNHQYSTCLPIQSMHNPWPSCTSYLTQFRKMKC